MHMPPDVPNYGRKGHGYQLQVGDTLCIEPMSSLGKAANHVADLIREGYAWSVRMDIRDYYGNIPLRELETLIQRELTDKRLFSLIQRYLHISIIQDGQIKPITKGIIQGSALSPLWGNLYLNALDRWLDSLAVAWCRYADDFLWTGRSEWQWPAPLKSGRSTICGQTCVITPGSGNRLNCSRVSGSLAN